VPEGYHYISEDGEELRVIDVIYDADDPGFTNKAIRIIAQQPPSFGEWQCVEDDELLKLRLSSREAAEEKRMNSVEVERDRRVAHLEALPGHRAREYEESLDRAVFSFNLNATALITLAAQYVTSVNDDELSEHSNYRLANALFNFLASAGTLREVQRVVHRKMWPMRQAEPTVCDSCHKTLKGQRPSVWEEEVYGPKLKETFGNDAAFLLKLRDYAVHYEPPMPSLTTNMSWGKDQPYAFERNFPLSRNDLYK
jgi:hypothetical protein